MGTAGASIDRSIDQCLICEGSQAIDRSIDRSGQSANPSIAFPGGQSIPTRRHGGIWMHASLAPGFCDDSAAVSPTPTTTTTQACAAFRVWQVTGSCPPTPYICIHPTPTKQRPCPNRLAVIVIGCAVAARASGDVEAGWGEARNTKRAMMRAALAPGPALINTNTPQLAHNRDVVAPVCPGQAGGGAGGRGGGAAAAAPRLRAQRGKERCVTVYVGVCVCM